ncbi:hypothetical protein ACB371_03555 [Klebsiella pneumoniae]
MENNAFGASAGTNLGFWFSQTPDCDTDYKGKLAEDVAEGNAVVSAHQADTVGLGILPKGALVTACHRWGKGVELLIEKLSDTNE